MKKITKKQLKEFLRESNAIEQVVDEDSLKQAQYAWEYLISQPQLTVGAILKTHKILMLHQNLQPNEKGYFRTVGVTIGGRHGMEWEIIREVIEQWVDIANEHVESYPPAEREEKIRNDHILYETIHPFVDGNGRTGRMFMNWQRVNAGLPLLIIHADYIDLNGEQRAYYKWFR